MTQQQTPTKKNLRNRVGEVGFKASLFFLVFLSGILSAIFNWAPYRLVCDAISAGYALVEAYNDNDNRTDPKYAAPTVVKGADIDDGMHFFASGRTGYLPELSSTGSCLAWIMNRKGEIQHVWEYDQSIWADLEHVTLAPVNTEIRPVGYHIYEDGGLLVSFHGKNCWPYAIGLARFDVNSRLLWKKELFNHHWLTVSDEGHIYVGSVTMVDSPYPLGDTRANVISEDGKVCDDRVMILDGEGNVLDEISMLEALIESGWTGLFQSTNDATIDVLSRDPTHLNDVRVVNAALAATHDLLEEGDMLVSMRNINTIGILDGKTKRFKWLSAGATIRQHSPRFFDGGILIFDNRGGPTEFGGSRLVKIDLDTQLPTTVFPTKSTPPAENPFYAEVAGHIDLLGEERALVSLGPAGNVWEIDLKTGKRLWEYVFVHPETRIRRAVDTVKYLPEIKFALNRTKNEIAQR